MLLRAYGLPGGFALLFACGPDPVTNKDCDVAAAGAACSQDGQVCDVSADLCNEHNALACKGGSWQAQVVAPLECSACVTEGEYCSPGCEDPCQFCNVVRCEGGAWQGQEVFPADCPSCDVLGPFVLAAGCSEGPVDQADCLAGCEFSSAGDCQTSYHQSLACAGSQPTFSCDGSPDRRRL